MNGKGSPGGVSENNEIDSESSPEVEIQNHIFDIATIPPTIVDIELCIRPDYNVEDAEVWQIFATAKTYNVLTVSEEPSICASLVANVFDRDKWDKKHFHWNMGTLSDETLILASEVFDERGRLRRALIENPTCKGTGVFSDSQLDSGTIAHIRSISVTKDLRRNGIGKRIVDVILEKAGSKKVRWLFAYPAQLNTDRDASNDPNVRHRNDQIAILFWRSVGFRRVGNTPWFCYAMDPNHKSRAISVTEDFDPPLEKDPDEHCRDA